MYLTDNGMQCNYSDKTFIAVQNNPSAFTSVRFSSAICSTDRDGLIDRYCFFGFVLLFNGENEDVEVLI